MQQTDFIVEDDLFPVTKGDSALIFRNTLQGLLELGQVQDRELESNMVAIKVLTSTEDSSGVKGELLGSLRVYYIFQTGRSNS